MDHGPQFFFALALLYGRSVGESMAPVSSHAPMLLSSTMAWLSFPFLFWVGVVMEREEAPPSSNYPGAPCLPTRRWKKKEGMVRALIGQFNLGAPVTLDKGLFVGRGKKIIRMLKSQKQKNYNANVAFPAEYVRTL